MEQQPVDVLGVAIDRLIAHCQGLDRDRTELARAVARLQAELVEARGREQELSARLDASEERQRRAADRLDVLIESLGGTRTAVTEAGGGAGAATMPAVLREADSGPAVAKAFDINRLEKIVRGTPSAPVARPAVPLPVAPVSAPEARPAAVAPEGGRDRLF